MNSLKVTEFKKKYWHKGVFITANTRDMKRKNNENVNILLRGYALKW